MVEYDFTLARNGTWARTFDIVNDADEPYDLTGMTFDLDVRYMPGQSGPPLLSIPIEIIDNPTGGKIAGELDGLLFDGIGNPQANLRVVYDLVGTQDGIKIPLAQGVILVTPGVSDNAT